MMAAAAVALTDWFEGIPTVQEARKRGAKYTPWKLKDYLSEMLVVKRHLRLFCCVLHGCTFDAEKEGLSEKDLAKKLGVTHRMVQYYVAEAEASGLVEVKRKKGRESLYRFPVELVRRAGALMAPKPKPAQDQLTERPPSLVPTKNPNTWRMYLPDWFLKQHQARAEARAGQGPEIVGVPEPEDEERRARRLAKEAARAERWRQEEYSDLKRLRERAERNGQREALKKFDERLAALNLRFDPRAG